LSAEKEERRGGKAARSVGRAEVLKRMADMLKQGATMLDLQCPACSSPLFRLRSGEIWCVNCQKRVIVVREGERLLTAASDILLSSLEETILEKLRELDQMMRAEKDPARLGELGSVLSNLLDNLEKVRRILRRGLRRP